MKHGQMLEGGFDESDVAVRGNLTESGFLCFIDAEDIFQVSLEY